jgi:hypothetical protein
MGAQFSSPAGEADATKLSLNLAIRQQLAAAGVQFAQEANNRPPPRYCGPRTADHG